MVFMSKDSFTSSFLILIPLIYFPRFIALARIFRTILKEIVRIDIFALYHISGGKHSDFHH